MKAIELLETLVGKDLRSEEIACGEDLALYAETNEDSVKLLKGQFEDALYFVSSNKKALCFDPDVIENDFGCVYYFWKIEV
jgi:hypothetical protein|nr:MAG TPA_asm: hypothetical protein [Caudoviricetes sp.]